MQASTNNMESAQEISHEKPRQTTESKAHQEVDGESQSKSDSPGSDEVTVYDAENHQTTPGFRESAVPKARFFVLTIGICMGLFLAMIDTSIVATSLYTIGVDFNTVSSVNWVALAYSIAYLSCAVTFARLSDIIGRRNAFLSAYTLFFAFSLACGFARNLNQLIAFRAIQGIGGSGLYSIAMICLPEVCPRDLRGLIGSLIGLVIAAAGVLGPVLGGILTHYASWKWVFWINGPIGILSMITFFLAWPPTSQLPTIERRSWKEFDFLGSMFTILAAVLVVFAFQNAGESDDNVWDRAVFIAPLVCGILCWFLLVAWEYHLEYRFKNKMAPAFPIRLFHNRVYTAGSLATLFMGFPYLLIIYSFPIRAQVVSGKSPLLAGLMLLPMLGTTALGSVISGALNKKKNNVFEIMLTGAALMTLGCGLLTTVGGPEDDAKALGFLAFTGLGFGLTTAGSTILTTFETPIVDYAPAQGIIAQLRILGGSLGIAMSTSVLRIQVQKYLAGILSPSQLQSLGQAGSQITASQEALVRLAYSKAFQQGMIVATAVSGAAIIITLGQYRSTRRDVAEQRQALIEQEIARRIEVAKRNAHNQVESG